MCREDLVAAWVDGELDPFELRGFLEHIEDCAHCCEAMVEQQQVRDLFHHRAEQDLPGGMLSSRQFVASVMGELHQAEEELELNVVGEPSTRQAMRRMWTVAASLVVVASGVWMWQGPQEETVAKRITNQPSATQMAQQPAPSLQQDVRPAAFTQHEQDSQNDPLHRITPTTSQRAPVVFESIPNAAGR